MDDVELRRLIATSRFRTNRTLARKAGVSTKAVQRARNGHVSHETAAKLYEVITGNPLPPRPSPPRPRRCPDCGGQDFARVRWLLEGWLTTWYRCPCGEWWQRFDEPPEGMAIVNIDWRQERPR